MSSNLGVGFTIAAICLWIAGIIGYVMNIIKLVNYHGEVGVEFILRIVGIFAPPLGSILGWFV